MKKAILLVAILALVLGMATQGMAQPDVDCSSFDSQADAQEYLNADKSDPSGLDADDDGQACEDSEFVGEGNSASASASSSASPNPAAASQYQYQYTGTTEAALPETGGWSPLIALSVGILLIGGGLLARRIVH